MDEGRNIVLFAPPVLGGERSSVPLRLVVPIVVAATIVFALPRAVERFRWTAVVVWSVVAASSWWISLALVDGVGELTRGLYWRADYADAVARAA